MFVSYFNNLGSCVICTPLSGVLVGTISLYVVQHVGQVLVNKWSPYCLTCRHSADIMLVDIQLICRPVCRPTLNCMSANMSTNMSADTWPVYWSTLGRFRECQLSVEYWSTVSGILIDYWWHISWLLYNLCFKIRMGELGFSVTHEISQFGDLKIVSVLLFVSSCVSLAKSTCWFLLWFSTCFNVRLSLNTSQRQCHSGPYFFKKKKKKAHT